MTIDIALQARPSDWATDTTHINETSATMMLASLAALSSTAFPSTITCINAYLDLVAQLVGVRSTFISQLTSSAMRVIDAYDNQGCGVETDSSVPLEWTFCQHVRATGEAVVVMDASIDVRVVNVESRAQFSIGAYLGVPLMLSDGTLFGTLCALDPQPCQFRQTHVDLMRIAASQIATLIEREGLHNELDHTANIAEQQLSTARSALDQQTELLRVVAHDVRTPLTTITGYSSLLKSGLFGSLSQRQSEVLDRVGAAARFINRLANDLIDTAASETQRLALIIEDFDPQHVAEQVVAACEIEAQGKGLTLLQHSAAPPATIAGDPDRLQQILLNLMSNAVRYTERGSIKLSVIGATDTIEFHVEDTGPGISAEVQEQIWQRYTRATKHGPGLGLGLYVVRQLATAMGGSVGVESTPGCGSCFWLRLPVHGPRPQSFQWT